MSPLVLMFPGHEDLLGAPGVAQASALAASLGLWNRLRDRGVRPRAVMGHGTGEYAALVAAGVLTEGAALRLVQARGQAILEAGQRNPGAMAAITGLPRTRVADLCEAAGGCVVIASENTPDQVVISGALIAVGQVAALARGCGAREVRRLGAGAALHSPLMAPAEAAMLPLLHTVPLASPNCAVVSGVTGDVVGDIAIYRRHLSREITRPVRWWQAVARAKSLGGRRFVEIGPGRTLSAAVRACDPALEMRSVGDALSTERFLAALDAAFERPVLLAR